MIYALLELLRPVNLVLTAAAVALGAVLAGGEDLGANAKVWLAALSAAMVAAGGNAFNDACDAAADRVNRPGRPVPSGRLSVRTARWWGLILMALGVGLGGAVGLTSAGVALAVSVLLAAYSWKVKSVPLVGNLVVATCAAATLGYGALAVGRPAGGLMPSVFAFLIHLGREMVKTAQDVEGDRAVNLRTLATAAGVHLTRRMAAATLALLIGMTFIPPFLGAATWKFAVLAGALADLPLTAAVVVLIKEPSTAGLDRAGRLIKLAMAGGLVALYVG